MTDTRSDLRAHAYVDGELDAAASLDFETQMQSDPGARREVAAAAAVSRAVRARASRFAAPPALRARLIAPPPRRRPVWLPAALALAAGLLLGLGVALLLPHAGTERHVAEEVVSSHVRSLLASHLTDVASSDQHTVKPWLGGQLDFAPPVRDFAAAGFTLVGARLDYVDKRAVAALVYRYRQHLVNVFIWPERGPAWPEGSPAGAATFTERGFNVAHFGADGMAFWLVSDLNAADLDRLAALLKAPPGG